MAKDEMRLPFPTQLSQEVDRLFDEIIHRPWGSVRTAAEEWSPQIDLYETDTAFILEADLPGVQEQEVAVTVENGDLVLRG
jgi:HSP20 family protein